MSFFTTLFIHLLVSICLSQSIHTCKDVYESMESVQKASVMDTVSFHHITTSDDEVREVLCAFISINDTASFVGTLFESFTLLDGSQSNVSTQAMFDDFAVQNNDLNTLHSYRWTKDEILTMHQYDHTHLLITCNFDISMTKDYVFTKFYSEFLWDPEIDSPHNCFHVDSVNIRGHQCDGQTVNIWSLSEEMHFHIESDECFCDCCPWNHGSVPNEDNFGFYSNSNSNFSCSAEAESTTNYWIGDVIHHQTCKNIYFASNQSFTNHSTFLIQTPEGAQKEIMCAFIPLQDNSTFIATLFESFSVLNGAIFSDLQFESLYDDYPMEQNESSLNIAEYRWNKALLTQHMALYDTPQLFITCNLDTSFEKDYILMDFYPDFLWNNNIDHTCYKVKQANIRGQICTDETVSFTSISQSQHFHVDSSVCECNCCQWNNDSIISEDNFGFYANVNTDFSCNDNDQSTTNYWIGTILAPDSSISTTPFYTTTTQFVTTKFPTDIPSNHATTFPSLHPTIYSTTNTSAENVDSAPQIQTTNVMESEPLAKSKQEQVFVLLTAALVIFVILALGCLVAKRKSNSDSKDKRRVNLKGKEIADTSSEDQILTDVFSFPETESGDEYLDNDSRSTITKKLDRKASYDMLKVIEETEEISFSSNSAQRGKGEDAAIISNSTSHHENSDKLRLL